MIILIVLQYIKLFFLWAYSPVLSLLGNSFRLRPLGEAPFVSEVLDANQLSVVGALPDLKEGHQVRDYTATRYENWMQKLPNGQFQPVVQHQNSQSVLYHCYQSVPSFLPGLYELPY